MTQLLALAQGVDQAVTLDALGLSMTAVVIAVLIGAVIAGVILGVILWLVAPAVLKHRLGFGSSFLAMFVYTVIVSAISFALLFGGMVTYADVVAAQEQGPLASIMPYGPVVFLISQAAGLLILTWSIKTFAKGPSGESPSWGSSLIIAILMIIISFALSFVLAQLGVGAGASR